jgi:hypothetical protein
MQHHQNIQQYLDKVDPPWAKATAHRIDINASTTHTPVTAQSNRGGMLWECSCANIGVARRPFRTSSAHLVHHCSNGCSYDHSDNPLPTVNLVFVAVFALKLAKRSYGRNARFFSNSKRWTELAMPDHHRPRKTIKELSLISSMLSGSLVEDAATQGIIMVLTVLTEICHERKRTILPT